MYNKKPPFEIRNAILDEIAEIAELVGQVNATSGLSTNPMLRRTNHRAKYPDPGVGDGHLEWQVGYRPTKGHCRGEECL